LTFEPGKKLSPTPGHGTERAGRQPSVPADGRTRAEEDSLRRKKSGAAILSVGSNFLLVMLKLIVGFSIGSISVLSEALHSTSDLMASGITLFSVRVSDTPPDEGHPYGHGKLESLSGLFEALVIFTAAVFILYESITKLLAPVAGARVSANAGLAVMLLSVGINVALSRHLLRVASESDSLALKAKAAHVWADVLTGAGVFIGLALVKLTGRQWIDSAAAIAVALLILRTGWSVMIEAFSPLLDARLPAQDEAAIRRVLEEDPRVLGYHKLRTRKSGSQRHADVHVQIDDFVTLIEAHDVAEELEDRIRAALPAISINIHIEPYHMELRHQREAHGADVSDAEAAPEGDENESAPHTAQPGPADPPRTGPGAQDTGSPGIAQPFLFRKQTSR
jgi:cation diffusion facilitator family transporter